MRYLKRAVRRIKICWAYLKQGWKSYDWDYCFLLDDIEFKLQRMRDYFEKNGMIELEATVKTIRQIEEALGTLDCYREGTGRYRADDDLEEKYGKLEWWTCEIPKEKQTNDKWGPYKKTRIVREHETYHNYKNIQKDQTEAYEREEKERVAARRKFFKLLEKNIERWWD